MATQRQITAALRRSEAELEADLKSIGASADLARTTLTNREEQLKSASDAIESHKRFIAQLKERRKEQDAMIGALEAGAIEMNGFMKKLRHEITALKKGQRDLERAAVRKKDLLEQVQAVQ